MGRIPGGGVAMKKYRLSIEFQSESMEEVTKLMENVNRMARKEDHLSFRMKSDNFTDKFKRYTENLMKKR